MSEEEKLTKLIGALEDEVMGLISNLERDIASYLSSSTGDTGARTKTSFKPSWTGVRGNIPFLKHLEKPVGKVWRWLWKGQSEDNPDYSKLYKKESKINRPTLQEYLEVQKSIDALGNEILSDVFGNDFLYSEETNKITSLINKFRNDFRRIVLKYKKVLAAPSEPAPSEPAPSEPAPSEPAPSEPAPSEPASGAPSEPASGAPSEPASGAPSEPVSGAPSEPVSGAPVTAASGSGSNRARKTIPDAATTVADAPKDMNQSVLNRELKKAIKAVEDKKIPDPNSSWIEEGRLKINKVPMAIAWIAKKGKDITKDDDVIAAFREKGIELNLFKIAGDGGSLLGLLRKTYPLSSTENFEELIRKLTNDGKPKPIERPSDQATSKPEPEPSDQATSKPEPEPSDQAVKKENLLDGLYIKDGKTLSKEEIISQLEEKILSPLSKELDAKQMTFLANWWGDFRDRVLDENSKETIESLILKIKSESILRDILNHSKSKKTIGNLLDYLKT